MYHPIQLHSLTTAEPQVTLHEPISRSSYRETKPLTVLLASLFCSGLGVSALHAGSVINTNLPADTTIVNIDARADGAGAYSSDTAQSFWYQPTPTAPSITLPAGTYRFRVIDRKDAASRYPKLTPAQLDLIYTAWSYNSPWTENYLVFRDTALGDPTEHQLFDGAPFRPDDPAYSSPQEAYDATVANGSYNKIRPAPPGRAGTAADFQAHYTFSKQTTLVFVIPDYGLFDNSGGVSVVVSPAPSVLGNISTRLRVETGDQALFGGFILTGKRTQKVIIRALGPSLSVQGSLANPTLELHGASGLIAANDNWKSRQRAAITATGIPPAHDLESAIVATLPGNNAAYTAIVRGVNATTGIGAVEVYDLDAGDGPKLANISTRGFVQQGDDVLIGGLIVVGGRPANVIFRGLGPSLAGAGVNNTLQNPVLALHNSNGARVASNDDWQTDPAAAEIEASGIAPDDPKESAMLRSLVPGVYTAIVRGVNGTGIGQVEAYHID